MDYTLLRYRVDAWEERAYHYAKEWLRAKGFWVSGLNFEADLVVRGLIVDKVRLLVIYRWVGSGLLVA